MTCEKFESVIGYHCSPVLMGMKPANLVSFSKERMPELPEIISDYKEGLEREGIRMEIICGCRKHYLLLVYRPDMLQEYLAQDEARNLLLQDGYNIDGSLDEMIAKFRQATEQAKQFNSSLSNTGAAKKLDQYLKELPADLDYLESKFQGAKFKMPNDTVQSFTSMRSLLSQMIRHKRLPCTISCRNSSIRQHSDTNSLHRSRKILHLHQNYRIARICLKPKLILG